MNFNIRSIFVFFILFEVVHLAIGQNNNPFDIRSRLKNAQNIAVKSEISIEDDSVKVDNVPDMEIDSQTLAGEGTLIGDSITEIQAMSETINPFEVEENRTSSFEKVISNDKSKSSIKFSEINFDSFKERYRDKGNSFVFWILLFTLLIIAVIVTLNRELIIKIIKSVWFNNLINNLLRNFGSKEMAIYILLFLNFLFNLSLFLYLVANAKFGLGGFYFYLWILLFVFIIYMVKHLAIIVFSYVFSSLKNIQIYNFTVLIFNIVLGIFIIVVNSFTAFSSIEISYYFMYFGIGMVAILYIFRLLRGILSTYNYLIDSIFHFFIYICAFEFLPLLFIYKFFIDF